MSARTTNKSDNSFFAAPTAKAKGGQGRKPDAKADALLNSAPTESFSIPVSSVVKSGSVTEYHISGPDGNVVLTYNKVKGWAERNGRSLAAKGMGFYPSADGQRLNISTTA